MHKVKIITELNTLPITLQILFHEKPRDSIKIKYNLIPKQLDEKHSLKKRTAIIRECEKAAS